MDEVRTKKIEIDVNQDKIDCSEDVTYWRKAALERVSTESEKKRISRLSTFKNFFNLESKECKDSEH